MTDLEKRFGRLRRRRDETARRRHADMLSLREMVTEAKAAGWSITRIADAAGVTRVAIYKTMREGGEPR